MSSDPQKPGADPEASGGIEPDATAGIEPDAAAGTLSDPDAPANREQPPPRPFIEGPGTLIGPYKLLEKIGEGGMGAVYMAEQDKPVRRRVALKIIKPGMDTEQVIARFEAERQALALMDHPNIAKVVDAGAFDTGRPFFVMDLANAYRDVGRLADALPMLEKSLALVKAKLGPDHPHALMSMYNLARVYLDAKPTQAEPLLREFLAIRQRKTPDDWRTFETTSLLGASLLCQKKCAEAEPLLLEGYAGLKARELKIPAPYRHRLADAGARIVALYDTWGKNDKAAAWRVRLTPAPGSTKRKP